MKENDEKLIKFESMLSFPIYAINTNELWFIFFLYFFFQRTGLQVDIRARMQVNLYLKKNSALS